MFFNNFFEKFGEWLGGTGPQSDVCIASRIRLVRNLKNAVFPHRATHQESKNILENVFNSAKEIPFLRNSYMFEIKKLERIEQEVLVERHLISKDLIKYNSPGVIFDEKEIVSIMINEEDHLRMQCLFSGLDLINAYRILTRIDDELSEKLDFAFHPDFGYLSACPTNTGTGIRASVLVHLPALVISEQIGKILNTLGQMGLAIRGFYGEGTEALGNFFQVSNQKTLGKTEEEIIESVEKVTKNLINKEREVRQSLLKESKLKIEDSIFRALGILSNARLISSKEAMQHLSMLRLGVEMGIIDKISVHSLNKLLILIQPSHLRSYAKIPENNTIMRDKTRADIMREQLRH
ncbi:MAG: protein arginine kinase [Candidatus Hydrogenedentota bacterium]